MGIPNLIDPRMLSQVGAPPPLQQSITPVSLPTPPPAPPMVPPPDVPTGLGFDALPTRQPPQPNFTQVLVKAIPMLLAGIAASRGGPAATTGLLAGYTDAMEKRRLLEEKQHEFDVQTAASEQDRQMRVQEQLANRQARIGNYLTDLLGKIGSIDDPAQYAATIQLADDTAQKAFGTPKGFIATQLGGTFDKTKALTRAQKDAQTQVALLEKRYGDQLPDLIASNADIEFGGKRTPIRSVFALAGGQAVDEAGEPILPTPQIPTDEKSAIAAAVRDAQAEARRNGVALSPEKLREVGNKARTEWLAAGRVDPNLQQVTFLDDGVLTIGNRDPKTGVVTAALGPDGKKIRAAPTQAITNINAARDFAQEEITADRPDPVTANKIDPATGLTPNTLYQGGMAWALTNLMPALGQSNSGQMGRARQAIINKGSAIAAQSGTDLPSLRAEYKAKAPALTRLTSVYVQTAPAAGAANDSIDLAIDQAKLVPRGQRPIANTFRQWLATGDKALSSDPELAKLQLYIYTAARDYGKVVSGSAASVAGLTDYQAKAAENLISAAQSPETFANVAQGMQQDMKVVTDNQNKQIGNVSQDIANFLGNATGLGVPPPGQPPPAGTGGTGRQTGAGPAGGPPPPKTPTVTVNGRTVTGPTGKTYTYPTVEQAQAYAAALRAAYGIK